jgi:hypothetical protein
MKKLYYACLFAILSTGLFLTSCEDDGFYGYDGRPGKSYLGLEWDYTAPDYIDVGTGDVPPVFNWGQYYLTYPGIYTLYYEGEVWNGFRWTFYAWEIDYEVFIIPGEPGGRNYNGRDGADSYFTLELTPYGPNIYRDIYHKKTAPEKEVDINKILESEINQEFVKEYKNEGYGIKIKYRRVEKRER